MPTETIKSPTNVPASGARIDRLCCGAKIFERIKRRNRIQPSQPKDLKDREFFEVSARRVIHILRPDLKNNSERFYEPSTIGDRPESINDNFFSRWARRPHPSGDCRCSFRRSMNSSSIRLSSHEEKIISQELQRIRTSLYEAEKSGQDIEELERNLGVIDLRQLEANEAKNAAIADECAKGTMDVLSRRLEPLSEEAKQRVVKDLDRYISDLLDEILDDTIRDIVRADNLFDRPKDKPSHPTTTFDIKFSFHSNEDGDEVPEQGSSSSSKGITDDSQDKGYVNQGFVGSVSDPDTLDFHLRRRLMGSDHHRVYDNVESVDSGINSVETVELQTEHEQNLEQSLMDIIDAKLGGTTIGKSLENLIGMEMEDDAVDGCARVSKKDEPNDDGLTNSQKGQESSDYLSNNEPNEKEKITIKENGKESSTVQGKPCTENAKTQCSTPMERTSKSLDDVIEEPVFDNLRLEFKPSTKPNKESGQQLRRRVASRFDKTLGMIRRRLVRRFNKQRRKRNTNAINNNNNINKNNNNNSDNNNNNDPSNKHVKSASPASSLRYPSTRSQLRPDDLQRRRFPVPPPRQRPDGFADGEVTLRKRNRKPILVFIHGFGSSADVFESQLRYFADLGYTCLAPDLLGHGFSSAPRRASDYRFNKLLKDLEAVLLHYAFKPGKKCVIVAHNYGCSFATALAQKYASSIHQLVLIAGGGPIPLAPPPAREGPGHCCLRSMLSPFLVCGMSRGVMYSPRGRQHPYCGPEEAPWASTHLRHVLRGMSWPDGDHVFLRRICTPTLLIHGLRDEKVSLVQECQMERTIGKAVLEAIPTAGHIPMTDCPDQLNHMIHCFIDLWKNKTW